MSDLDGFQRFFADQPERKSGLSETELVHIYLNNPSIKVTEIAKLSGQSLPEFYRLLRRNNVEPNRLKVNQHLVMRYREAGYPIPQIAQLTGYTTRNVRYILAGLTRKNSSD